MKRKMGAAAVFCAGMLTLAGCSSPQTSYGAPVSDGDCSSYSSMDDRPQTEYGAPIAEDDSQESADESTKAD